MDMILIGAGMPGHDNGRTIAVRESRMDVKLWRSRRAGRSASRDRSRSRSLAVQRTSPAEAVRAIDGPSAAELEA